MTDHFVPSTLCWHCDRMLDATSALDGEAVPEPGSISLCMYCGAIAMFGPDLAMVRPSKEQLDELSHDDEFARAFVRFQWARQFVLLDSKLLGSEEEKR